MVRCQIYQHRKWKAIAEGAIPIALRMLIPQVGKCIWSKRAREVTEGEMMWKETQPAALTGVTGQEFRAVSVSKRCLNRAIRFLLVCHHPCTDGEREKR